MKAEIVYWTDDSTDDPPNFTIEVSAESDAERMILASVEGHPFNAVVVEGTRGAMLRVYDLGQ